MASIRILANDGIDPAGRQMLEEAGYEVVSEKIPQDELATVLPGFDAIIVRSATKVRRDLIDACPGLKIIARGGVGLDNIDVDYARSKNIAVYNTPAASSQSVAELVFAHILSLSRFLHQSNRAMPERGAQDFKVLKKNYSAGLELRGKTIGIIGFGRIGQAAGHIAIGLGMRVLAVDPYIDEATLWLNAMDKDQRLDVVIRTQPVNQVLPQCDFVTLHVPAQQGAVIGANELAQMKDGAILINASRGGVVDEDALLKALDNGKLAGAGLDVFTDEPTPDEAILKHPKISLSPHIGASTDQAQANIGIELAEKIIAHFS